MVDHDDDTDEHDGSDRGHSPPSADPVLVALQLCTLANNKTVATAIRKLAKLDRQFANTQAQVSALAAYAEQINAKLDARAAALDERDRALTQREDELAASCQEAHATLRASHDHFSEVDRRLRYRILSSADLLHGFNEKLQMLPNWQQIKQMIPGLPADLPATPPAEVVSENVREDWSGNIFSPSTLTRSINKVASQ
jgi:hypothetical protein